MNSGHTWALVLAAGDGSRLQSLTRIAGDIAVPKQFCSLRGGPSLLHEALRRAEAVADRERICTVVAQQHRCWWETALRSMPAANVIVQPENRGTANGILLPLLHIMERDPDARVVLLPSDHYVRDEATLARFMQNAVAELQTHGSEVILLGIEPDEVDPELGYIVPRGDPGAPVSRVERFVEKPSATVARELLLQGALWNVFIVAAHAQALLELFMMRFPQVVADMSVVVAHDAGDPMQPAAAARLYRTLPTIDFSRQIAQGSESALRVLRVPPCGWSDLGTPKRVAETLRRVPAPPVPAEPYFPCPGHLNLAARQALLGAG